MQIINFKPKNQVDSFSSDVCYLMAELEDNFSWQRKKAFFGLDLLAFGASTKTHISHFVMRNEE